MIDAVTRAVNRVALGTGVDGEAAVTAGHRPECINVPNWAWREATSHVWRQGATSGRARAGVKSPISLFLATRDNRG